MTGEITMTEEITTTGGVATTTGGVVTEIGGVVTTTGAVVTMTGVEAEGAITDHRVDMEVPVGEAIEEEVVADTVETIDATIDVMEVDATEAVVVTAVEVVVVTAVEVVVVTAVEVVVVGGVAADAPPCQTCPE